ncbi:hypothetical protein, partial [Klebsiella aerogenes]|uniref:hypothetical protein n=1 Tax=Klebsiella aerogenes TaxID=548 RepID=UPI001CC7D2CD
AVNAPNLVLVHGDANEMARLRHALTAKFEKMTISTPRNCATVEIEFQGEKMAKMIGKINESQKTQGILIGKDFEYQIV